MKYDSCQVLIWRLIGKFLDYLFIKLILLEIDILKKYYESVW
jgi:hypothetical protein